jgi:hypothetical protein|tara:strand:+ start:1318 stop:1482 length:165 start_codon:yes stop_codon:yes gene_type:complete
MTLEEVQNEIVGMKTELAKVPQLEARLHRLLGMEEVLLEQEKENEQPDLKVAKK